jgi:GrpB-like predicted nucleotidyltransferase (UPF0157 family)
MKIIIVDYNPEWPALFQLEKSGLEKILNDGGIIIEHIGSTSVEKLAAKPVIDILIGLENFDKAGNYIHPIISLGYQYISQFEDVMPFRRFFIKEVEEIRTHHIHMVGRGTEFWNRHLAFRDHLRNNAQARNSYADLKKELSKKEWKGGNEYASAKTAFIQRIEKLI